MDFAQWWLKLSKIARRHARVLSDLGPRQESDSGPEYDIYDFVHVYSMCRATVPECNREDTVIGISPNDGPSILYGIACSAVGVH